MLPAPDRFSTILQDFANRLLTPTFMAASSRFAVGVHVLVYLVHQGKRPASSAEIAMSVNTHPVVLRRLLAAFVRARLVQPRKGAAGGFVLTRDPATVSLLTIFQAVESTPILGGAANAPRRACPVGAGITRVIKQVCTEAQRALEAQLGRTTLATVHEATCGGSGKKTAQRSSDDRGGSVRAKILGVRR